eukprot:COSAG02_NODE_24462_length_687_cov_1.107143_1_plen_48_part_10
MEICDAMVSSGLRDAGCESCQSVTTPGKLGPAHWRGVMLWLKARLRAV